MNFCYQSPLCSYAYSIAQGRRGSCGEALMPSACSAVSDVLLSFRFLSSVCILATQWTVRICWTQFLRHCLAADPTREETSAYPPALEILDLLTFKNNAVLFYEISCLRNYQECSKTAAGLRKNLQVSKSRLSQNYE